jgi:hypothetical protein
MPTRCAAFWVIRAAPSERHPADPRRPAGGGGDACPAEFWVKPPWQSPHSPDALAPPAWMKGRCHGCGTSGFVGDGTSPEWTQSAKGKGKSKQVGFGAWATVLQGRAALGLHLTPRPCGGAGHCRWHTATCIPATPDPAAAGCQRHAPSWPTPAAISMNCNSESTSHSFSPLQTTVKHCAPRASTHRLGR